MRARALALAGAVVLGACGGGQDEERARAAAEDLYAAAKAGDGQRACELLGQSTVQQLEKDEKEACEEAVTGLELAGSRAERTAVFINEALVRMRGGDTVFLEETPSGWRVSAAGCKPPPSRGEPFECEVES